MPGFGFGHGFGLQRVSGGLDAATQALLSQATTDGYTAASGTTLTALDAYIKGLKADGIWSKLDILYVFATNGDSDFATYNILDPTTFQATKVNAPTFTSLEGFAGDGVSSKISTSFDFAVNGVNFQQNSASQGFYKRSGASGYMFAYDSGRYQIASATNNVRINTIVNLTTTPNTSVNGFHMINRSTSTASTLFINGSSAAIAFGASISPSGTFEVLGGPIFGGVYANSQASIAFAGADLSAEASDFFTRTEAYMDAIGSGVVA